MKRNEECKEKEKKKELKKERDRRDGIDEKLGILLSVQRPSGIRNTEYFMFIRIRYEI